MQHIQVSQVLDEYIIPDFALGLDFPLWSPKAQVLYRFDLQRQVLIQSDIRTILNFGCKEIDTKDQKMSQDIMKALNQHVKTKFDDQWLVRRYVCRGCKRCQSCKQDVYSESQKGCHVHGLESLTDQKCDSRFLVLSRETEYACILLDQHDHADLPPWKVPDGIKNSMLKAIQNADGWATAQDCKDIFVPGRGAVPLELACPTLFNMDRWETCFAALRSSIKASADLLAGETLNTYTTSVVCDDYIREKSTYFSEDLNRHVSSMLLMTDSHMKVFED